MSSLVVIQVVFLHVPSGTLLVTDLYWNYAAEDLPLPTRLYKLGMDRAFLPLYKRLLVTDYDRYEAARARILGEGWDWDAILPCHGSYLGAGGKAALRLHLQYDRRTGGKGLAAIAHLLNDFVRGPSG